MITGRKVTKKLLKIIFIIFISLSLLLIIGVLSIYFIYGDQIRECYHIANEKIENISANEFSKDQTSLVYDKDNNILMKIKGSKENYYLLYEDIPDTVKKAFIAIEDHRFLEHNGVDYISTIRAAFAVLCNSGEPVQGGSTITQQLARNVFLSTEKTMSRKLTEVFIAWGLEDRYSKEDILEFYINNINYSNGCYGIEAAAKEYFGQSVSELTDSQMIFLCAIPQNPTYNDPRKYMTNTLRRRDNIIRAMENYGYITSAQKDAMLKEKITIKDVSVLDNHNYIETYAKHAATEAIMECKLNFEFKYDLTNEERASYEEQYKKVYDEARKMLETDGYSIYTSLSLEQQGIVQTNLDDILAEYTSLTSDEEYSLQGAVTIIDNETGLVTAIVGGRTPLKHIYTINRAYQSHRQPGSSIKPIIAYTPYFEDSTNSYSDIKLDKVTPLYEGQDVPSGTGKRTTILNAVKWSYNGVPWNIVRDITTEKALSYLKLMEFSEIVDEDNTEAISLGGFTYGVSTLEMASAFSTIERGGIFISPSCITKIVDSNGNVIYSHKDIQTKRVYTETACNTMIKCLESVINGGTGSAAKLKGIDCAGKTGTSNDEKDSWFVGFTPYYTAAIWVGHDIPKEEASVSKNKITASLFKKIMEPIHRELIAGDNVEILGFDDRINSISDEQHYIFDQIVSEISVLNNTVIDSIEAVEDFENKYSELENLIETSIEVLTQQEFVELTEKLEDTKRKKWNDILRFTNSAYTSNTQTSWNVESVN